MSASLQDYIAALRSKHSTDALLAVPMGDFFEFFGVDAVEVSDAFGIHCNSRAGLPMCGVPRLDSCLARLVGRWPQRLEIAVVEESPRNGNCALVDPDSLHYGDGAVSVLARPFRSTVDAALETLGELTSIAMEVLPAAERRQLGEALRQKLCLLELVDENAALGAPPWDRVA